MKATKKDTLASALLVTSFFFCGCVELDEVNEDSDELSDLILEVCSPDFDPGFGGDVEGNEGACLLEGTNLFCRENTYLTIGRNLGCIGSEWNEGACQFLNGGTVVAHRTFTEEYACIGGLLYDDPAEVCVSQFDGFNAVPKGTEMGDYKCIGYDRWE